MPPAGKARLAGIGADLFPVVLGTADMGTAVPRDGAFGILDAFAEAGGNVLDTAAVYASWLPGGDGLSEKTVGDWITSRDARSRTILSTKGGHHDLKTGRKRMNLADLTSDIESSLERLRTDRIDLYWLHRDDPGIPTDEILGWLAEISGKFAVSAFGCSNWTVPRQREAERIATEKSLPLFCASQIGWNLAEIAGHRAPIGDAIFMDGPTFDYHRETGRPVFAFESQARGLFSGKLKDASDPGPGSRVRGLWLKYGTEANLRRIARARTIAEARSATPTRIALAWLLHQPFPTLPIIGPKNLEQLADSLEATRLDLGADEIESLRHPER